MRRDSMIRFVASLVVLLGAARLNAHAAPAMEPCDECDYSFIWDAEYSACGGAGDCPFIQQCYKQYNWVTQEWEFYYTVGACEPSGGEFCMNPYFCP